MRGNMGLSRPHGKRQLLTEQSAVDVVVYAVYLLGGAAKRVDTEDIAVKANEVAPGRFVWSKYPDQINLELIRVSLSDAKKPEKGKLLAGSGKTGWSLTPSGLKWVLLRRDALEGSLHTAHLTHETRRQSPTLTRYRKEKARIEQSGAWAKWVLGEQDSLTEGDAREVFRIDPYTDERMVAEKLSRLLDLLSKDDMVSAFLNQLSVLIQPRSN
jgi:hypothetical protein